MIGAILLTAGLAILASAMATIGNFAMSRDFPNFEKDQKRDVLLDSAIIVRFMQYKTAAGIFHRQALVLWGLLGVLLIFELVSAL